MPAEATRGRLGMGLVLPTALLETRGLVHYLPTNPDVSLGGIPMRARVVDDKAERSRLWTLADRVFARPTGETRQAEPDNPDRPAHPRGAARSSPATG